MAPPGQFAELQTVTAVSFADALESAAARAEREDDASMDEAGGDEAAGEEETKETSSSGLAEAPSEGHDGTKKKTSAAAECILSCPQCLREDPSSLSFFLSREALAEHMWTRHVRASSSCADCGEAFRTDVDKARHACEKKQEEEAPRFTCDFCGVVYRSLNALRGHQTKNHGLMAQQLNCPKCSRCFSSRDKRDRHLLTHTNLRPHNCPSCKYKTFSRGDLINHLTRAHPGVLLPEPIPKSTLVQRAEALMSGHGQEMEVQVAHGEQGKLIDLEFKCNTCGNAYVNLASLRGHQTRRHGCSTEELTCQFCNRCFSTRGEKDKHLLVHTNLRPHNCPSCKYKSFSKGDLVSHLTRAHPGVPLPEPIPNSILVQRAEALLSGQVQEQEVQVGHCEQGKLVDLEFKCSVCGIAYDSMASLRSHQTKRHGLTTEQLTCQFCNRCFSDRDARDRHLLFHTSLRPHRCPSCDYQVFDNRYLKNHMTKLHPGMPVPEPLPVSRLAKRAEALLQGEGQGQDLQVPSQYTEQVVDLAFVCDKCDVAYPSMGAMRVHRTQNHGRFAEDLTCLKCGKKFKDLKSRECHVLAHTHLRPHKCRRCAYQTFDRKVLSNHLTRLHPGVAAPPKPIPVSTLAKRAEALIQGQVVPEQESEEEAPPAGGEAALGFACDVCGAVYESPALMKGHRTKMHGPFAEDLTCQVCGKRFRDKDARDQHLIGGHTTLRPHKCPKCDYQVWRGGWLKRHMSRCHKLRRRVKSVPLDVMVKRAEQLLNVD